MPTTNVARFGLVTSSVPEVCWIDHVLGGAVERLDEAELAALGELQRGGPRGGAIAQRHALGSSRSHELVALDEMTPGEDGHENSSAHACPNNSGTNGGCASARWT